MTPFLLCVTPLPNMRSNIATWAVPTSLLPAVAAEMRAELEPESFDPLFQGQQLETTYFDTAGYDLRRARLRKDRYLTLRVRCYKSSERRGLAPPEYTYAVSAKTEAEKWRQEIDEATAEAVLRGEKPIRDLLPPNLLARLLEITNLELVPVVAVCCRRYAVEDDQDRLTLDCCVYTDRAKQLGYGVLEYKSTNPDETPPGCLIRLGLRPLKLSKFLWATEA